MYGKHFESMYTGSMYGQGFPTFAVWGYIISHVHHGIVELNPKLLAGIFGESEETIAAILEQLCEPDPHSRSLEHEGRRLLRGGQFVYKVVNVKKYNDLRNEVERKEYKREWERQNRPSGAKKAKVQNPDNPRQLPTIPTPPDPTPTPTPYPKKKNCANEQEFLLFWKQYPNKKVKADAWKWWKYNKPDRQLQEKILHAVSEQKKEREEFAGTGQWHAEWAMGSTWLSKNRWEDEITTPKPLPGTIAPAARNAEGKTQLELKEEKYEGRIR